MATWKRFNGKKSETLEEEPTVTIKKFYTESSTEINYHEILYSKDYMMKDEGASPLFNMKPWHQRRWENIYTIEETVDLFEKRWGQGVASLNKISFNPNIDKKVDRVLEKVQKHL